MIAAYSAFQRASVPSKNVSFHDIIVDGTRMNIDNKPLSISCLQVFNRRWLAGFSALFVGIGTVRAVI
jgi:hypothetical protein